MPRILGLPPELEEVPGLVPGQGYWALGGDDWRDDWRRWAADVERERVTLLAATEHETPEARRLRALTLELCRDSPAYFAAMFGWLYEPRPDRPTFGFIPFVPFPFQVWLFDWIDARLAARGAEADGVVSKARDLGGTWAFLIHFVHRFLFTEPFSAILISRNEDEVDKKLSQTSIYKKLDDILGSLPPWISPWSQGRYDPDAHRGKHQLNHPRPGNENFIAGDATTTAAGRGDRAFVALVDEAAQVRDLLLVMGGLTGTVSHKFALSSETVEKGTGFQDLQQGRIPVVPLDWWLHPNMDEAWHEQEQGRYDFDPYAFEREVNRNARAGFGLPVYPIAERIIAGDFPYLPGMLVVVGIDPGKDNETGITVRAFDPVSGRWRVILAYCNSGKPPEFYAALFAGVEDPQFDYASYGVFDTRAVVSFFAQLTAKPVFCGDRSGNASYTKTDDGWYKQLATHYYTLRKEAGFPDDRLYVQTKEAMQDRTYTGRHGALMRLLAESDFDADPSVVAYLAALRNYRFENNPRPRVTEQAVPKHTWESHLVTADEYAAVYLRGRNPLAKRDTAAYDGESGKKLVA